LIDERRERERVQERERMKTRRIRISVALEDDVLEPLSLRIEEKRSEEKSKVEERES